ncbi:peptidoglycan-binding protein [Cellulomonas sp. URHE0023]|uniref:peptidoglycan-binding domain-containing protein n=1 Tax=Cellulomonas sp. URHE0023 TaxID=1380354 RepID=UPI000481FF20|nr:peptidoglycan-binding domain-containing protein [Cellulomonas sp. URHE0023]
MGLGPQVGTVNALVTFARWCQRNGLSVGEMYGFGPVHSGHVDGSWHLDSQGGFGKAADINQPAGGQTERNALAAASDVAVQLGLGAIYARFGTDGPSAQHTTHLHVDVGGYTNLGDGERAVPGGGDVVTEQIQRAVHAVPDQIWGADTDQRIEAVRAASRYAGHTFPWGVAYTQSVIGTTPDGTWGPRSAAAHDASVRAIQGALRSRGLYSGAVDGIWGPGTEAGYRAARGIRKR